MIHGDQLDLDAFSLSQVVRGLLKRRELDFTFFVVNDVLLYAITLVVFLDECDSIVCEKEKPVGVGWVPIFTWINPLHGNIVIDVGGVDRLRRVWFEADARCIQASRGVWDVQLTFVLR